MSIWSQLSLNVLKKGSKYIHVFAVCGSNIRFGELFLRLHVLDGSRSWGWRGGEEEWGICVILFGPIVGPHVKTKLKGDNKTQQLNLGKSSQERFVFMDKIKPKVKTMENHTCEEDKAQR